MSDASDFDVAIIGMAGRFPDASSIEELWRGLLAGRELTAPRVLSRDGESSRVALNNTIPDPFAFDAAFFGMRPREAMLTDPQHRVFLECCYHALEHAGYPPGRHDRIVGLFASAYLNTYLLDRVLPFVRGTSGEADLTTLIGNEKDHLATLVAWKLSLRGPAMSVQTACSSSLVAVHLACESLSTFQCDLAVAGGVTLSLWQSGGYERREGDLTARDGHCRAFDEDASGTVYSNGATAVVLKRLSDALADGDTIYAVVKGSAINNDAARRVGYAAPSVEGQAEVIERALSTAGVSPGQVAFIEGHGTGTRVGDEIEVEALHRALARPRRGPRCALGSVKANIGHLGVASGVAGLIKASLALHHRVLPPQINVRTPLRRLSDAASPLHVPTVALRLPPGDIFAGVSSFGLGGTNAHVLLGSAPACAGSTVPVSGPLVFPFSARTPRGLRDLVGRMAAVLPGLSPPDLHRASVTLQHRRGLFPVRRAVVAGGEGAELARALQAAVQQTVRAAEAVERPDVVLLLPACAGAGRAEDPALAPRIEEILADIARASPGRPAPLSAWGFAAQVAMVERLVAHGVQPTTMIGDGAGEVAALFSAGALTLERSVEALDVLSREGPAGLAARYASWLVEPSLEPVRWDVLLGEAQGVRAGQRSMRGPTPPRPPEGWWGSALLRLAAAPGVLFVEVGGPGAFSTLYEAHRAQLAGLDFLCLPFEGQGIAFAGVLAAAWTAGSAVRWPPSGAKPLAIPGYPFERGRYEITATGEAVHRPFDPERAVGEIEPVLRDLWHELFGATEIADGDTLFEHGAESLAIAVYARALRRMFGVDISFAELHAEPTFGGHVRLLRERLGVERARSPAHVPGERSAR